MKTDFDRFEKDRMINDPVNYKWGIFYFNPKDHRVIVPKRIQAMGWTLNFGNIYTYLLFIAIVAVILVTKQLV
jgi:uncharacterized membrane protein